MAQHAKIEPLELSSKEKPTQVTHRQPCSLKRLTLAIQEIQEDVIYEPVPEKHFTCWQNLIWNLKVGDRCGVE